MLSDALPGTASSLQTWASSSIWLALLTCAHATKQRSTHARTQRVHMHTGAPTVQRQLVRLAVRRAAAQEAPLPLQGGDAALNAVEQLWWWRIV